MLHKQTGTVRKETRGRGRIYGYDVLLLERNSQYLVQDSGSQNCEVETPPIMLKSSISVRKKKMLVSQF